MSVNLALRGFECCRRGWVEESIDQFQFWKTKPRYTYERIQYSWVPIKSNFKLVKMLSQKQNTIICLVLSLNIIQHRCICSCICVFLYTTQFVLVSFWHAAYITPFLQFKCIENVPHLTSILVVMQLYSHCCSGVHICHTPRSDGQAITTSWWGLLAPHHSSLHASRIS